MFLFNLFKIIFFAILLTLLYHVVKMLFFGGNRKAEYRTRTVKREERPGERVIELDKDQYKVE